MRLFTFLVLTIALFLPFKIYAGGPITQVLFIQKDQAAAQISAPYDLRDRKSYIQISNVTDSAVSIHVQIFQHDRGCAELNFDDELTANDTVVYDLENIVRNNGSEVPINLADDSNGYVVVSDRDLDTTTLTLIAPTLIGNFRIVDEANYEYRANMAGISQFERTLVDLNEVTLQAHFNTVEDAIQADLIGYTYDGSRSATVRNYAPGISFDVFMYDMAEEPLSCDRRNFACGNIMNYGINENYPNSRNNDVICPGGGLANPDGGFVDFINGAVQVASGTPTSDDIVFVYYIGINNGNGTGSMDTWIDPTNPPVLTCETSCNDLACNGLFFDGEEMGARSINWTIGNSGTCEPGEEMTCDDMFDNDNDKLVDCEDPDCMDQFPCGDEVCDDEIDNDNDNSVDCADDDCIGILVEENIMCEQPETSCFDCFDNDGNGLTDCGLLGPAPDPECVSSGACCELTNTCGDDDDDSGGGGRNLLEVITNYNNFDISNIRSGDTIDACLDVCLEDPNCESGDDKCSDDIDNDSDNATDCEDIFCDGFTGPGGGTCEFRREITCNDGVNNDPNNDMDIDCADEDCFRSIGGPQGQRCEFFAEVSCEDNFDNDGNGLIDCGFNGSDPDPNCENLGYCATSGTREICNNGFDDDGDSDIDCGDSDCNIGVVVNRFGAQCEQPETSCFDGIDNDGNSAADCSGSDANCISIGACGDDDDDDSGGGGRSIIMMMINSFL